MSLSVLIALSYICGFLSVLCGILMATTFTKAQRERFPILKKFDGKQVRLLVACIVFGGAATGAHIWKEVLTQPTTELTVGPGGELAQTATPSRLAAELEGSALGYKSEAIAYFDAAYYDLKADRYRDAAYNFQKSIDILPTASAYLNLGVALWFVDDLPQAHDALLKSLQHASKGENPHSRAGSLVLLGQVFLIQGKIQQALAYAQDALDLFRLIQNSVGEALALSTIGRVHRHQRNLTEALAYARDALNLFHQSRVSIGEAEEYIHVGNVYSAQGNLTEAMKSFQEALRLSREIGSESEISAYLHIGHLYQAQGKLSQAQVSYQVALERSQEIGNPRFVAAARTAVTIFYVTQGQLDKEEWVLTSGDLKQSQQIGSSLNEASSLFRDGVVHLNQGKLSEALASFQKVLTIAQKMGYVEFVSAAYAGIGNVYLSQKNFVDALRSYQSSIEGFRRMGDLLPEAAIHLGISYVHILQSKLEEALTSCRTGVALYQQLGFRVNKNVVGSLLRSFYLDQGMKSEALEALKHAHHVYQNQDIWGTVCPQIFEEMVAVLNGG